MCDPPVNTTVYNILLDQFADNLHLDEIICSTCSRNDKKSITELVSLLEAEFEKRKRIAFNTANETFEKMDLSVANIIESSAPYHLKKTSLLLALRLQEDEFNVCTNILNVKVSKLDLNLEKIWDDTDKLSVLDVLWIASAVFEGYQHRPIHLFESLNNDNLKKFIMKMCTFKVNRDIKIDQSSLFFNCFEVISLLDGNSKFFDKCVQFFIKHENLDYLSLLFEKKFKKLSTLEIFQEDIFWNFIKRHIISDNKRKRKQAEYTLRTTNENFKTQDAKAFQLQTDFDYFLILLEMSKEKQLHLIQPTLQLLPSITNLDITWQSCLYRDLLKHTHLDVVYYIVQHILKLEFSDDYIYRGILRDLLMALNKFNCSNLGRKVFSELEKFCGKLNEFCCLMLFEEFVKIEWNSVVAWSVLKSKSNILNKFPKHLFADMLLCLKKLPDLYIQRSCFIFFIKKMLDNPSDSFEKVMLFGNFLYSTKEDMSKETFCEIVEEKKDLLSNCTEKLNKMISKAVEDEDLICLLVCFESVSILQKDLQIKMPKEIPSSACGDLVLLYFPNLLQPPNFKTYIIERSENMSSSNNYYFFQLLDMLFKKGLLETCNEELIKQVKFNLKNSEFNTNKFWMSTFRRCFSEGCSNSLDDLHEKFQELLSSDDETDLITVLDNLDLLLKYSYDEVQKFTEVLDSCLRKLCTLPNNSMKKYSAIFFRLLFRKNLFNSQYFLECWRKWHLELFDHYIMDNDELIVIILEGCLSLIAPDESNLDVLISFIVDALTKGSYERDHYEIYQEIHDNVEAAFLKNPNVYASKRKVLSIECLCRLSKLKSLNIGFLADSIIEKLMNSYRQSYGKRYSPQSKIHLYKLRIIQTMLLINNVTDKSKEKLVTFILTSLCEESHQPSVKILLQWLILRLVHMQKQYYLEVIIQKLKTVSSTNSPSSPNSCVALLPVIYYLLATVENPKCWCEAIEALLPCTMGANFKLRVSSQIALLNILKRGRNTSVADFIDKYSFLEKCSLSALEGTRNSGLDDLRNEFEFLESFDHIKHHSVKNILISIPKMVGVPPSEWQNISKWSNRLELSEDMKGANELPPIIHFGNNDNENVMSKKKIVPWTQDLEEKIDNKSLSNLICVASLVDKCANLGGLSRTCEAFKIRQLVLHNSKIKDDKEFASYSMSSEKWVEFIEVKKDDLSKFLGKLKEEGYSIVGLEQTSESVMLNEFEFKKKSVILLGNEKEGIPAYLLPYVDSCVEIPQFGQTRSLNVHVAGATCIWEYAKQHMV